MKDYIVTVMARDRVGIVRDVSSAVAGLDGNITNLSQTVMRGYFTLIISAEMPNERTQSEIRQAVERRGDVGEFEVSIKPYVEQEIFDSGHAQRFTLVMQGKDQKGIIARSTYYLSAQHINVDDFYCCVHEGILLMLAQISIPAGIDVEAVQTGLEKVGEEYGLTVYLQHENIFKVTSDVRPVIDLQRRG